jgi:hypothetical protein
LRQAVEDLGAAAMVAQAVTPGMVTPAMAEKAATLFKVVRMVQLFFPVRT